MTTAFIIGNGPSLAKTNLDLLEGKLSYACNNIHLIYPKTKWRPTHYVRIEDPPVLASGELWYESVIYHLIMGIPCYLSGHFYDVRPELHEYRNYNYKSMKPCGHREWDPESEKPLEWHLPQICHWGGSVPVAMQLAIEREKVDQIVLVGCDMYPTEGEKYFHSDYNKGIEEFQTPPKQANQDLLWAHMMGINYHRKRGLKYDVINATVGGKLDLYPRAKLEDLVKPEHTLADSHMRDYNYIERNKINNEIQRTGTTKTT